MRLRLLSLLLLLGASTSLGWADTGTSTTTLTIDPSATSGATITASDENDRNNDASTWANAHVHRLSNTTNFGDGTAGNKSLCADTGDLTDACIRRDDTNDLWLVDNPTAGSFNQIVVMSGTAGLLAGTILKADGRGALLSLTSAPGSDDQALVWDSSTAATPRTLPNCTDTSGQHLNYTQSSNTFSCGTSTGTTSLQSNIVAFSRSTTGSFAITGMGFQPTALYVTCTSTAGGTSFSVGFGDDDNDERDINCDHVPSCVDSANIFSISASGGNSIAATLTSLDSDGATFSASLSGTATADCNAMGIR